MSSEKEIFTIFKNLANTINSSVIPKRKIKIPKGNLLEWDEVEEQFYKIAPNSIINSNMLINIEKQKKELLINTKKFCDGLPANNALLWGARGTGKSSLIYCIIKELNFKNKVSIIEIKNFQLKSLGKVIRIINSDKKKYIIYCDDLAFDFNDNNFLYFKSVLDGTLRKNSNCIFYVTSNYRHIVKSDPLVTENQIIQKENLESSTALSDRFGLWLGFPSFNEEIYLRIVINYKKIYNLKIQNSMLRKKALQWSILRGSFSGREASNFIKYMVSQKDK